jgi:hypothetical protein
MHVLLPCLLTAMVMSYPLIINSQSINILSLTVKMARNGINAMSSRLRCLNAIKGILCATCQSQAIYLQLAFRSSKVFRNKK